MKTLVNILGAAALLLAAGCEKEIPLDVDGSQDQLVINCLFDTDSTWVMEVSKSRHILLEDQELSIVDNANVRIVNPDGSSVALDHWGDGIYGSSTASPNPGERYRVEVDAPDLESVWAENEVSGGAELISIDTSSTQNFDIKASNLHITLRDIPNERNFYNIKLRAWLWEYFWNDVTEELDSNRTFGTLYFTSSDPTLTGGDDFLGENGFGQRGASFTDELFANSTTTIDVQFYPWRISEVYVVLSTGTEEYYLYEQSYNRYQQSNDNPFAQPVQVYTNVNNGLGIFAGVSSVTDSVIVAP